MRDLEIEVATHSPLASSPTCQASTSAARAVGPGPPPLEVWLY
jgi:hypothetical protein